MNTASSNTSGSMQPVKQMCSQFTANSVHIRDTYMKGDIKNYEVFCTSEQ